MNREAELLDRIAALEARVAQLEARPQPTYAFGGAGNWSFPWGSQMVQELQSIDPIYTVPSQNGTVMRVKVTGDNVSRETSKGPNGAGGPK